MKLKFALFTLSFAMVMAGCKKDKPYECTGEIGVLCNVAGIAGSPGGGGNDGKALEATLYWPQDVFYNNGIIYITDWNNHCVRKIDDAGVITRFIGSGFLGDGTSGQAAAINLNHPTDLCLDPQGNFILSSWHNWKFKKIDKTTLEVSVLAGTSQGFSGDGGPATAAQFNLPSCGLFDANGDLIVCDQANQRIRKIEMATGTVITIAGSTKGFADGNGTSAQFALPAGSDASPGGKIALSNDKSVLYIADTENNRIRQLDLGTMEVTTIAGTGVAGFSGEGSNALSAQLNAPTDVAVAADGAIYIADAKNHCVRKLVGGLISTVAGKPGQSGASDDGTVALEAKLNTPSGIFITPDYTLFIADTYNHQVKKVVLQ